MESCLLWCIPERFLGMQSAFRGRPGEAGCSRCCSAKAARKGRPVVAG